MTATNKDITHKKSFTPNEYFIVKDEVGDAIDLITNNWTVEMNIRRGFNPNTPIVETFTTANSKIELDTNTTGRINFNFDGTEFSTEIIRGYENKYDWDMQVVDGISGNKYDIYQGDWTVTTNL